jgi:hypothetical protein
MRLARDADLIEWSGNKVIRLRTELHPAGLTKIERRCINSNAEGKRVASV